MKTLDELKAIKQKQLDEIKLRESKNSPKVVVGMGTCGIAAGARDVMKALLDELGKREVSNVAVSQVGCVGICGSEPLVEVTFPGQPMIRYGNIDANKVRQIVAQHLVNGVVVESLQINKPQS